MMALGFPKNQCRSSKDTAKLIVDYVLEALGNLKNLKSNTPIFRVGVSDTASLPLKQPEN